MNSIFKQIANELNIRLDQVEKTVELIDGGDTIPFIARYRKEVTGSLSDLQLRDLNDRLTYLRNLQARREEVSRLIDEQGKLTEGLSAALNAAQKLSEIDDIYRPYKPKRRTRATIAKQKGLEALANFMLLSDDNAAIIAKAAEFIDEAKVLSSADDALQGARDIVAEYYSDMANLRDVLRSSYMQGAIIVTEAGKVEDEKGTYDMYFDSSENAAKMPAHRVLAINRGERDSHLKVRVEIDDQALLTRGIQRVFDGQLKNEQLELAYQDACKRLIIPALERELRSDMTSAAEEQAINVFGINLKQLLLQPPLRGKVVMGYDPAYRTGCKIAVIDAAGKLLDYQTIYPTKPQQQVAKSEATLLATIKKYRVSLVAIGNGTASRESEQFVANALKKLDHTVHYIIVNEAGASVYSASPLATKEYPDVDVSIRGAISIGARVQDPLSELVKIDPKAIGVGQYQHDVNQTRLASVLDGVVEDAVNGVGVDVNIASEALLGYVAGISKKTAAAIVDYRHQNGVFKARKELLKVKGLGAVAYKQCAGFMRLVNPVEVLDGTGVHPESYDVCYQLMQALKIEPNQIGKAGIGAADKLKLVGADQLAKQLDIHKILLNDLVKELDKPARDPREDLAPPLLRADVLTIEDLEEGMVLKGTVRNVVDFGAFVDIGVKQDGLVHISELANRFVKRAMDVVAVGDIVDVKVIGIDVKRHKVSLSIKQVNNAG